MANKKMKKTLKISTATLPSLLSVSMKKLIVSVKKRHAFTSVKQMSYRKVLQKGLLNFQLKQ